LRLPGSFGPSTLQFVGAIDVNGRMVVVKIQRDRQCHGRLGRCQDNDEQGDEVAVEANSPRAFAL
jgi:hypothetical protein